MVAYVSKANVGDRWDSDINHILNGELSKKQNNSLFYYALGKAYNSLYWIDKSWIEKIMPIEDNENWIGFMVGFHIHHNTVTQVFEYFCKTGQYDRFFANRELFDSIMQKMVVQYMCVAYHFEKIDFDLNSPLFVSVIKGRNRSDYENIIQFFNVNSKHIPTEKIKDLWRFMYDVNKILDCDVAKYFIGKSYRWLGFFDNIDDEIKEWMLLSTKNLQFHAASQVIRRLNDFTTKSPMQVGELLLTLVLSESKIPIYSDLEIIVEELFKLGYGETAKHIANECLCKGYLGLRDIVRKYSCR